MNLKKMFSLAALIGGISLCGESSMVHAVEYEQAWIESWGGSNEDYFKSTILASDGGIISVGYSNSSDAGFLNQGFSDAIIIKYDQEGNQQWMKSWGGDEPDYFDSVAQTSDGGIVAVGISASNNTGVANQGVYDAIIVKYDSDGNQEWMNSWGGNSSDYFTSVAETLDQGLIVVGYSFSTNVGVTNQGGYDGIIVKYNQEGNQEWAKSWGGRGGDFFYSVDSTSDGGFLVVGQSNSRDAGFVNQGQNDSIVVKYDQDGNQEWVKSWGGDKNDTFELVNSTFDNGFIVMGYSNSTNAGFENQGKDDAVIIKYDPDGKQEWMRSWGGDDWDYLNHITQTLDEGFIAVGYSKSTDIGLINQGLYDGVIVKHDPDGNQEWVKSWGGTDNDYFSSIIETSNGELVVTGYSASIDVGFTNQGNRDTIILKFSPKTDADIQINGTIQTLIADVTIPSVSPDLVIDPNSPDGVMSPEFEITNDSTSPIKLELKTFEQTTTTFNDVLPGKYDSWEGLNRKESQDIALGLVAKEGDGWQQLTTPTSYVSGHTEHEIGVVKPMSQVNFEFDVHHGRAFSEAKKVQYRMVFVFDLLN